MAHLKYSTITVQYSTAQYSTVQYRMAHHHAGGVGEERGAVVDQQQVGRHQADVDHVAQHDLACKYICFINICSQEKIFDEFAHAMEVVELRQLDVDGCSDDEEDDADLIVIIIIIIITIIIIIMLTEAQAV